MRLNKFRKAILKINIYAPCKAFKIEILEARHAGYTLETKQYKRIDEKTVNKVLNLKTVNI
jgi:hypothetical protein